MIRSSKRVESRPDFRFQLFDRIAQGARPVGGARPWFRGGSTDGAIVVHPPQLCETSARTEVKERRARASAGKAESDIARHFHTRRAVLRGRTALKILFLLAIVTNAFSQDRLAITGAIIYPSPEEPPVHDRAVIIVNGQVAELGARAPTDAEVLDASGLTLFAGFWNAHVHFTEPKWARAQSQPVENLSRQLEAMLTRFGFTTVVDTGSDLANTHALRDRIESGDVRGPLILCASGSFVPENGRPIYIEDPMPELTEPDQAATLTRLTIERGADAIKMFTGTWLGGGNTGAMPKALAAAVVREAHRHGKLVLAHPQSRQGVETAVEAGVDILAHTAPSSDAWDGAWPGIALIPTLQLWRWELERGGAPADAARRFQQQGVSQLRTFAESGGTILFGTDVGYMTIYDPSEEYRLMVEAGMSFQQVLASLTTAPAERFGVAGGRIAPGMPADIVLLDGNPRTDPTAWSRVRYTLRDGRIVYRRD